MVTLPNVQLSKGALPVIDTCVQRGCTKYAIISTRNGLKVVCAAGDKTVRLTKSTVANCKPQSEFTGANKRSTKLAKKMYG